jgi:hypothetical protein
MKPGTPPSILSRGEAQKRARRHQPRCSPSSPNNVDFFASFGLFYQLFELCFRLFECVFRGITL